MNEFVAEIIATMIMILLGNGVVANVVLKDTKGHNSGWIVISLGWGLAVMMAVIVAGPISGAHLNPAVTLGLAIGGLFPWPKVPVYIAGEIIGAMLGAILVWFSYHDHFKANNDKAGFLGVFATTPAIRNHKKNFLTELIGTFVLIFVIFYITDFKFEALQLQSVEVGLGSIGALPVALLVTAIGLSLGGPTGYAINPARDLGPRIIHSLLKSPNKGNSDWAYAWVPILGPITGAALAAGLFLLC